MVRQTKKQLVLDYKKVYNYYENFKRSFNDLLIFKA